MAKGPGSEAGERPGTRARRTDAETTVGTDADTTSAGTLGARAVLGAQAAYYALTGLWPVVHMPSFEAVTGPKTDDWLVHMVGLLTVAVAAAIWPGRQGGAERNRWARSLAVAAAVSFLIIDVVYAALGMISRIYLADAVLQVGFITAHALLPLRASAVRGAGRTAAERLVQESRR